MSKETKPSKARVMLAAAFALLWFPRTSMADAQPALPGVHVPAAGADCSMVSAWHFSPRIATNPDPNYHRLPTPDGSRIAYGPVFVVKAPGADEARKICAIVEQRYPLLLVELGLRPLEHRHGRYSVTIYSGEEEYRQKAKQPARSGGCTLGNAIYTYQQRHLDAVLAHELTHLILMEQWGGRGFPWLDEGLARVMEERVGFRWTEGRRSELRLLMTAGVSPRIEEIETFKPLDLESNESMIWHQQVTSLVEYMLAKGGKERMTTFVEMQARWSTRVAFDIAMSDVWPKMVDLERDWKAYLWQADHLEPAASPE